MGTTGVEDVIAAVLARHAAPQQPEALCAAGARYILTGDFDTALALFDRALRLDPTLPRAWTGRASILFRQGRAEAFGCVQRALENQPDFAPALVLKGDVLRKKGAREEALACFEAALMSHAENADAWLSSATVLYELKRFPEAARAVERFLEVAHEDHRELLTAQMMLADLERKGARAKPAPAPPPVQAAPAPRSRRSTPRQPATTPPPVEAPPASRKSGSMKAEKKSLRKTPSRKSLRAEKKSLRTDVGSSPSGAARRSSKSLPAAKPGEVTDEDIAIFDEVRTLSLANRNVEALRKLEPIAKRCPDSVEAWLLRAVLLFELKQFDPALTSADRVKRLDPNNLEAARLTVKILTALKKDDRALAAADVVIALAPRDPEAHRSRADCLVVLMRQPEAIPSYEKVLLYAPDDALAWFALGRTQRQLRRFGPARVSLNKALALSDGKIPDVAAQAREIIAKLPPE